MRRLLLVLAFALFFTTVARPALARAAEFGLLGTWSVGTILGMDVAADGHVYVAKGNGGVAKYTRTGVGAGGWATDANDLAVGPDGNIYVADTAAEQIRVYTPSGGSVISFSTLDRPWAVATDAAGNVYVLTENFVYKHTSLGVMTDFWGGDFEGLENDIAIAGSDVYVLDTFEDIEVYDTGGAFHHNIPDPAADGIETDSAGNVWAVGDRNTNTNLRVYTRGGSVVAAHRRGQPPCDFFENAIGVADDGTVYVERSGRIVWLGQTANPANYCFRPPTGPTTDARPRVQLKGIPNRCARRPFAFKVKAKDDVRLRHMVMRVNGRSLGREKIGRRKITFRIPVPVRRIRRQLPAGYYARFKIEVAVTDSAGQQGDDRAGFKVCR